MKQKKFYLWTLIACIVSLIVGVMGAPTVQKLRASYSADKPAQYMLYGYAAPTIATPGSNQISEYNSFIGHRNNAEIYNTTNEVVDAQLDILKYDGTFLTDIKVTLPPRGSRRVAIDVEPDQYGTIKINGEGIVFRNYLTSTNEYVLPFVGK